MDGRRERSAIWPPDLLEGAVILNTVLDAPTLSQAFARMHSMTMSFGQVDDAYFEVDGE